MGSDWLLHCAACGARDGSTGSQLVLGAGCALLQSVQPQMEEDALLQETSVEVCALILSKLCHVPVTQKPKTTNVMCL